ncbi:hypothetical protein ACFQZC_26175 [Streptacidiphilus monticola]
MSAWISLVVGCSFVVGGICVLNGWRAAQYLDPRLGGWATMMGAGFVLDGLPRVLGWPSSIGVIFGLVGFVLIVIGAVAALKDMRVWRRSRKSV